MRSVPVSADRRPVERLVRGLGITAAGLCVFTGILYLAWGPGPRLIELTWFNAFALVFQALTCIAVSYVALGRYRVLNDPASYWVGVAFAVYGTAMVQYVLVWPGLLPDGGSFLASRAGTPAWFTVLALLGLWLFLQIAARAERDGTGWVPVRSWVWTALLAVGFSLGAGSLLIAFESRLPLLVSGGSFTPLLDLIYAGQIVLFAVGTWLAARESRRSGDPLLALAAYLQLALAFVLVWVVIGSGRYSLWWYLGRVGLTAGAMVVLFGLLAEHVTLLRREREKSRALVARSAELEATEARLLANYAELQSAMRELKEEDRRKNEFLAMLSHELRNPLATISSVLQVLSQAAPSVDSQLDALRQAAMRQASHMSRLLEDLLDVSRITGGRVRLTRELVELAAIVEAAVEGLRPRLEDTRQQLTLSLARGVTVQGDPLRLIQAVSNLLDNAIKYTPEAGCIEVIVERYGVEARVCVRDDGIGIPPDRLDAIFDLFIQGEQSLDRAGGGLGIGLTLSRTLVEMHEGSVTVHSAGVGQGSEFVILLPMAVAASPTATPPAAMPPARDGAAQRRVLLVEDSADTAQAMTILLETLGHEVATAGSGESALVAANGFQPDLVLLDLGLPGMDGYETARRLRSTPGLESATLVALTGYGRDEDRLRTREAGFDHHLVKPVELDALKRLLGAAPAVMQRA